MAIIPTLSELVCQIKTQLHRRFTNKTKVQAAVNVSVTNIDEDLIDLIFTTTNGTSTVAPTLDISLKIDELTQASEVQVLVWLIDNIKLGIRQTK